MKINYKDKEIDVPEFVSLGINGSELKLKLDDYREKFIYHRIAGNWDIDFIFNEKTKKLFSHYPSMPHLHNIELISITKEKHDKDNKGYI